MRVVLINPPHSNPTGPTLGLAVLSSFIKVNFQDISTEIIDLSIQSFYFLLSTEQLLFHKKLLDEQIEYLESQNSLTYQELLLLQRKHLAKSRIVAYGKEVKKSIETLRNPQNYSNSKDRERAIMVINSLLESIGDAYPGNINLSAGDYRSRFSPFSILDIVEYVNKKENPYFIFFKEWLDQFNMQNVSLVGISISFAKQMLPAFQLAKMIKKKYPSIFIQIGGSMMAHLKTAEFAPLFMYCDAIVQKEGELPLSNILNKIRTGRKLDSNDGAIFLNEANKLSFPAQLQCIDVAQEKTPDFSTIPFKDYLVPFPVVPLQIGRACYWGKCSFCCLNAAFSHKQLWRTAKQIVDYIKEIVENFHINTFEFVDDAIPPKLAEELSDLILSNGLVIRWFSYARFDNGFSKRLLNKMSMAGCVGLKFGLESASPKILALMNKGIDLKHVQRIIKDASDVGLNYQVAFFVGFPTETNFDRKMTIDFLKENVIPNGGVLAFNGWFRILKDMPIIKKEEFYNKITKWNTSEELIDYYVFDKTNFEDMKQFELLLKNKLFKNIIVDYVRSVDRRRYWFNGLCSIKDYVWGKESTMKVSSHYDLQSLIEYRDKRFDDFRPGKGIYATKSYISSNLLCDATASILNRTIIQRRGKLRSIEISTH